MPYKYAKYIKKKKATYEGFIGVLAVVEDVLDHVVSVLVLQQLLRVGMDLLKHTCNKPILKGL